MWFCGMINSYRRPNHRRCYHAKQNEQQTAPPCFFCCLAYFSSYMTRINYAAVRLAIADELSLTYPELVLELGIAISAASVTYGLGQLVSGILGDKLAPVPLVCAGLGGVVLCNHFMPILYPSVYVMALVWGINGFFQSLIRPPSGQDHICEL